MNKIIFPILVLVVIILVVVNVEPVNSKVVKIGILSPLTGNFGSLGEDFSIGIHIAAKEHKNIQIVEENTASDQKIAIAAINKLIGEGVRIFVSGPGSSVNLALVPVAEKNKAVLIAQSKTSKLDDAGEYIFRAFPPVDIEAQLVADLVYKKSLKNVAIIFDSSSDTSITAKDVFEKSLMRLGGKITSIEGFDGKTVKDFRTMVLKLKNSQPEALFFATSESSTGAIMKQSKELGLKVPFFGWSVHDTGRILEVAGDTAEGFIITAEPFDCRKNEVAAKYCSDYLKEAPDMTPQYYGAYAYDLINLISDLVEKHNGDIEKIQEGLSNIKDLQGVMGSISMDARGNAVKNDFIFKMVKGGKFVGLE